MERERWRETARGEERGRRSEKKKGKGREGVETESDRSKRKER